MSGKNFLSLKRLIWQFLILILISLIFWSFSRYPDLLHEVERVERGQLTNRRLGKISKEELMVTDDRTDKANIKEQIAEIGKTTINWLNTNKLGMTFGILFGAAVLALIKPLPFIRRYYSNPGIAGSLVGVCLGAPLGVCINCVAPIGLAMRKTGASLETALSAMFSSPSLNVVALIISFTIFPVYLAIARIAAILFLIIIVIPLAVRLVSNKNKKLNIQTKVKIYWIKEDWCRALKLTLLSFLHELTNLTIMIVPLMIVAGLVGSAIVTLFPLENFIGAIDNQLLVIVIAAIAGTILPIPMLVDLILVQGLILSGLRVAPAVTLLITLPTYSLFTAFVIGRYISWKLALILFLIVAEIGAIAGILLTVLTGNPDFINVARNDGSFTNVIKESGINKAGHSTGAAWVDYNGDSKLDLFIAGGTDGGRLYKNNGNDTFSDVTKESGIHSDRSAWSGVFGDYNNDGCPDLYITVNASKGIEGENDLLYRNNCNGTFTNVTYEAGIKDIYHGRGAAWADYDNDGYLDLYVANYGYPSPKAKTDYNIEPNILYHNNGDGTFTDATKIAGVTGATSCMVKGAINLKQAFQPLWFDYNNDGKIDLFVATDAGVISPGVSSNNGISPLYHNNGDGTFTDATAEAGLCIERSGMGVADGDYDNDGDLDLYVTNIGVGFLWRNNGDGTFTEVAEEVHVPNHALGWGVGFLDHDNDGDLDLYVVNGVVSEGEGEKFVNTKLDHLYKNLGDGTFTEVALKEGIYGNDAKEAAAFGDYNNDGFTDIIIVGSYLKDNPTHRLYKNKGNRNHWLAIQLTGAQSNRDGVGARITVRTAGKIQIRQVVGGSSYISQNSLWQTIGLGSAVSVETIEVKWPSGVVQTLNNIKADQRITVKEES